MEIDLVKTEYIELMYLQKQKFRYLVRDEIGTVVVFRNKPHIEDNDGVYIYGYRHWVESDLPLMEENKNRKKTCFGSYEFIQFEDKPLLIKDLTKNYDIIKKKY